MQAERTAEFVRELEAMRDNQQRALYKRGDEFIMVSTVGNVLPEGADIGSSAIVGLVGSLGGYATSGEETMAFVCDEDGEPTSWTEIAAANGPGSREDVLDQIGVVPPERKRNHDA